MQKLLVAMSSTFATAKQSDKGLFTALATKAGMKGPICRANWATMARCLSTLVVEGKTAHFFMFKTHDLVYLQQAP